MLHIHLHNLKFYSFHGIYEEEKILGSEFMVDVDISWEETKEVVEKIIDTVDYVNVFSLVEDRMKIATPLLETVAMQIGKDAHAAYPFLHSITVKIIKLQPGIPGISGSLGITWTKTF